MTTIRASYHMIPNPNYKKYPYYGKGLCSCCGKDLPKGRRRYCNNECQKEYLKHHPKKIYEYWDHVKYDVLRRDNRTCRECGENDRELIEVHHIIPLNKGGDQFDKNNCITLCMKCHKVKHRKRWMELRPNQTQLKVE